MRFRVLGKTGLRVSEVGFGAWTIGTDMYGRLDREYGLRLIKRALDLGINFFDTADAYGKGASELILGEALRGYGDDVVVSTKVGYDIYSQGGGKLGQRFDPGYLRYAALRSRERLGRVIDLLQLHNPPLSVIKDPNVVRALFQLVEEGVVRHVGVSLGPEVKVREEGLAAINGGYEAVMFVFNILEQEPGRELIREGSRAGVGLLTRVPHASNVLTDRFTPSFPPGDHRALRDPNWLMRAREAVERHLLGIAKDLGVTLGQLAIKFILSYPVSSVLLTVTSVDELEEYVGAVDGSYLGPRTLRMMEELYDNVFSRI